ncbi:TIGR03086 family metal-binding protein [Nocardioides sp. SR21]|uniref:TIGR03086 family metal-binding protein n=1 Tax=Nocardioides sp. SR21 TaxID=2919501 RepID=UPI001FAAB8EF|nr:TIGR03086 family metal-binding protein [Nocardioides sp. SR21]
MNLDDLAHAQNAVTVIAVGVAPDDWDLPTPCDGWDVAAVLRHLMVGERAFTTSLGGTQYDLEGIDAAARTVDLEDLPRAYELGARELRDALAAADPGATYPTGIGPMPPTHIAELRTIEALVHGWDLARGADLPLSIDGAVAERAIAHSRALMERLPADRTPFGPPQPISDDARAIDRLAALLGRTP